MKQWFQISVIVFVALSAATTATAAPAGERQHSFRSKKVAGSGQRIRWYLSMQINRSTEWSCARRRDTNGDGRISVWFEKHGHTYGYLLELYVALGGGPGTRIDDLVDVSADKRWLAVVRSPELELVDTTDGRLTSMCEEDTEDDGLPLSRHRSSAFSGNRFLYARTCSSTDTSTQFSCQFFWGAV